MSFQGSQGTTLACLGLIGTQLPRSHVRSSLSCSQHLRKANGYSMERAAAVGVYYSLGVPVLLYEYPASLLD